MHKKNKTCTAEIKREGPSTASDRGFTLLELLIAITLLVLIVGITMGAMRIGSRSVAAAEKKMEVQERFRTVISIMDAQIQSQVPLTYDEQGNKLYYFRSEGKALRFCTNYSIWSGQKGYVIVDYKVDRDDTGREVLYAGEQTPGVEGRRETWLLDAAGISFEYYHKDLTEEQGKWSESLSPGTSIPEKIRIRIMQGTRTFSLVFPVRVGGEIVQVEGGTPVPTAPAQRMQNMQPKSK